MRWRSTDFPWISLMCCSRLAEVVAYSTICDSAARPRSHGLRSCRLILARKHLHVLPYRSLVVRIPKTCGRMIGDDELRALITIRAPAQTPDGALHPDQQLGGELAEAADDPRLQRFELSLEIRRARFHFVRKWIAILGRTALEHVADVHRLAREPDAGNQLRLVHRLNDPGKQLTRATHERKPLTIFFRTRRLANEHDAALRRAR